MDDENDDGVANDLEESASDGLHADIAELLSNLSEAVDTPSEFIQHAAPFDASDVNFETGAWMSRLRDVQEWLRFDPELPSSSDKFLEGLLRSLDVQDPASSVEYRDGLTVLSPVGLGNLHQRADRALRVQRIFLESYEALGSLGAATNAWTEAWEEETETAPHEPLAPVSATASTWRISDFTGKKLNLTPSYQRGDVWGTTARQMLIESILRGIPLPSVILLRPEDPNQPHEVVDGKQRLTAILRFVGKHPQALDRVRKADASHKLEGDLLLAFNSNYPKFKRMWKAYQHEQITSKVEDEYFFPFKLRNSNEGLNGPLSDLQGKYFTQILDSVINAADEQVLIQDLFSGTPEYRIPVIVYRRASQGQIHEVFNLYNKQGMHLNAEEIRNAIYHELHLTRAILVAAGDSDSRTEPQLVAPALSTVWHNVNHLGATLKGYGFGTSRYKRTKVLAWVIAILLGDTEGKDLPSTARHIDDLLRNTKDHATDPLNQSDVVAKLVNWIADSARIHASYGDELWAPAFKDGASGQKWQELQLVGSLVGIAIAQMVAGNLEQVLEESAGEIYAASATAVLGESRSVWARPPKTQTRTQWLYIARVADRVCAIIGVDIEEASSRIELQFGSSGLPSLFALLAHE